MRVSKKYLISRDKYFLHALGSKNRCSGVFDAAFNYFFAADSGIYKIKCKSEQNSTLHKFISKKKIDKDCRRVKCNRTSTPRHRIVLIDLINNSTMQ